VLGKQKSNGKFVKARTKGETVTCAWGKRRAVVGEGYTKRKEQGRVIWGSNWNEQADTKAARQHFGKLDDRL